MCMEVLYRIPVHYQKLDYLDLFYIRCLKSLLCHGQLILLPILFLNMSLQLCETDYKGTWPALCYALLEICITKTEIYWNVNEINHSGKKITYVLVYLYTHTLCMQRGFK